MRSCVLYIYRVALGKKANRYRTHKPHFNFYELQRSVKVLSRTIR